eukprot:1161706-Pelagomonas_calceolata.AAC.1
MARPEIHNKLAQVKRISRALDQISFLQHNKELIYFMPELLDLLWAGVDQPQTDQLNNLAEGLPL